MVWFGMKKYKKYKGLAITVLLSACLSIMLFAAHKIYLSEHNVVKYNANAISIEKEGDYLVTDEYDKDNNTISSFFKRNDAIKILKKTYKSLSTSGSKYYREIIFQTLEYYGDKKFDKTFTPSNSHLQTNQQNASGELFTTLKSMQLSYNEAKKLHSSLAEGAFWRKRYYYSELLLPVVAGNEYKRYYKIGDRFTADYLGSKKIKFKIVGFLKKESKYKINKKTFLLDKYLIFPSQMVRKKDESNYAKILLSVKCGGFFHYNSIGEFKECMALLKKIKMSTGYNFFIPKFKKKLIKPLGLNYTAWLAVQFVLSILLFLQIRRTVKMIVTLRNCKGVSE
ncbi:hypothetical protein AXF21_06685 [Eubacterium minutum ATCC 700079]|nr:hypothetical protein AXF21_06685 [Eubacterium minutum ATCC 700079]